MPGILGQFQGCSGLGLAGRGPGEGLCGEHSVAAVSDSVSPNRTGR